MSVDDPRLLDGEPSGIYYRLQRCVRVDPLTPLLRAHADECGEHGNHEAMPIDTRTLAR